MKDRDRDVTKHGRQPSLADPDAFAEEVILQFTGHFNDTWDHVAPPERAAYDAARDRALAAWEERTGQDPDRQNPVGLMDEAAVALFMESFGHGMRVGAAMRGLHRALTGEGA